MATNEEIMSVLQEILIKLNKLELVQAENLTVTASTLNISNANNSTISIEALSALNLKADNGSTFANVSVEVQGDVDSIGSVCNGGNANVTINCEEISGEVNADNVTCEEISN